MIRTINAIIDDIFNLLINGVETDFTKFQIVQVDSQYVKKFLYLKPKGFHPFLYVLNIIDPVIQQVCQKMRKHQALIIFKIGGFLHFHTDNLRNPVHKAQMIGIKGLIFFNHIYIRHRNPFYFNGSHHNMPVSSFCYK